MRLVLVALLVSLVASTPSFAAAPDGSWLARASAAIAAGEYLPSAGGTGLQAPNRAHGFRAHFDATGVRLHERTRASEPLLSLRLTRLGRGDALAEIGPGSVSSRSARVEIRRPGEAGLPGVVEWYENSPAGLEHGLDLEARPAGEGALVVELALAGARASRRGADIVLETDAGRSLRYGGLVVRDATGAPHSARLEAPAADRIHVVVDDAGATYPLEIDPLVTSEPDTTIASDSAGSRLGWSVAGAGDVNDDGFADVIVGAIDYDAGELDEGAAFVFLGSADGISSDLADGARLESNQPGAQMGASVAGAGDVDDDGFADVIVGASQYDVGAEPPAVDAGAAFIFLGSATGVAAGDPSTAATRLTSDQAGDRFGSGVAGAGDIDGDGDGDVIVGAPNRASNDGGAFVFEGAPTTGIADATPVTAATRLTGSAIEGTFGTSVAGAGDVNGDTYGDVIVGAPDVAASSRGVAYVFHGSATGIADAAADAAATHIDGDFAAGVLGQTVAGAGDVNDDGFDDVIVGAPRYAAPDFREGVALVYHGSATGVPSGAVAAAAAQLESNDTNAELGRSVAGAGDINGDGFADVIVGAWLFNGGQTNEGTALIFFGGASGVGDGNPANADLSLEVDLDGVQLGASVAGAGDVDGDGSADVIVGATQQGLGGAAYLFVPEPGSGALGLAVLGGLAALRRCVRPRRRETLMR